MYNLSKEVPEIGVWMKDEPHGNDFSAHLHRENTHEDRLQLLQL